LAIYPSVIVWFLKINWILESINGSGILLKTGIKAPNTANPNKLSW